MGDKKPILWEQIAMYLTALPCPPLPLYANTRCSTTETDEEEEVLTTSHDVLAALLLAAMRRDERTLNERRKQRQITLTEALLEKLAAAGGDSRAAFQACCHFTAEYMDAFGDRPGGMVRFMDMDAVTKGDAAHRACCSWTAAQEIQHVSPPEKRQDARTLARLSYTELIGMHAARAAASLG
jgi:hypothetical protein